MEDALLAREVGMQSVPQFVGEREDISATAGPVEKQERMSAGHGVGAERSGALARAHRCVDPLLVEEPPDHVCEFARERAVGIEHDLGGLRPGELDIDVGDRGVAVVVGEPIHTEQLCLEAIPALRDVVAVDHGIDERLHRRVAGLIGEIAAGDPGVVPTQSIVGGLVGHERVEHERASTKARFECRGDGLGGDPALVARR